MQGNTGAVGWQGRPIKQKAKKKKKNLEKEKIKRNKRQKKKKKMIKKDDLLKKRIVEDKAHKEESCGYDFMGFLLMSMVEDVWWCVMILDK